jgi:sporulation protein YlmC with PRC-barrel domain
MRTTLALALFGAALISVPAVAQTPRATDQAPKATQQQATANTAPPMYQMKAGQWRATKLDGLDVYNPNNEKIGDINELIIDRDGRVEAVVIGVGGFLGMGEHHVAVPFEKVQWIDTPRESTTSANDRTDRGDRTAAGSGTSTVPITPPAGPAATRNTDTTRDMNTPGGTSTMGSGSTSGAATTTPPVSTTVDSKTGATVTTTTADHPASTTTTATPAAKTDGAARGDARTAQNEAYRGYPDHALVAMTKDQLKALPEVRYQR